MVTYNNYMIIKIYIQTFFNGYFLKYIVKWLQSRHNDMFNYRLQKLYPSASPAVLLTTNLRSKNIKHNQIYPRTISQGKLLHKYANYPIYSFPIFLYNSLYKTLVCRNHFCFLQLTFLKHLLLPL